MIGMDPFSANTLVIAIGVFLGAFVAGFAGFGLAAAAGAFLLHVLEPKLAVPLMMICSVCAQFAGLVYLRKSMHAAAALPFIIGGFAGIPVALLILKEIESGALRTGFGAFLITYSSWVLLSQYSVIRWISARPVAEVSLAVMPAADVSPAVPSSSTREATVPAARCKVVVGFFAGIIGGLTAMPGALLSIWADANRLSKAEQRGFVQPFILAMQLTALALMLLTPGLLTRDVLAPLYVSTLPLVLGTLLGLYLYGRASAGAFRVGVLAIVFSSGCGLVAG